MTLGFSSQAIAPIAVPRDVPSAERVPQGAPREDLFIMRTKLGSGHPC